MVWLRERLALLGSSTGVIAVAALLIAALDAISAGVVWWTIPAAGFLLLGFFVPALVATAVVRAATRGWWPPAASSEPDPRRAAAVIYAAAAACALGGLTFNAAIVGRKLTGAPVARAAIAGLSAVLLAALLVGLAPPIVRLLGAGLERLARRIGRAAVIFSRRAVLTWVGLAVLAIGYAFYALLLSPRLDDVAFSWMPPMSLGAALVVIGHAAIGSRNPRWLEIAMAALVSASIIAALAVRYGNPRAMLDMWGETNATSEAIAAVFDLEPLHHEYKTERPARLPGAPTLDVVLVTVDTWRADRTPTFGIGASMPELARFARTAVRFQSALAPSNNTRRSLTSMMIGAQPSRVRGKIKGWALALDPRHTLVAERFRAAGYQTAGFFCCPNLFKRETGFSRGVDRVETARSDGDVGEAAAGFLERALARPPGPDRPPVFVWIHLIGPHGWYAGERMLEPAIARRRYDRHLGRVDQVLGEILAAVGPAREHTVIALTSDHGEGLADHGAMRHSSGLYNSQLRVPLIVSTPGVEPRDDREPISLIHLAPTLLELAGLRPPSDSSVDPGSFAARVSDPSAALPRTLYAEQIRDRSVPRGLTAIVGGGHKLIVGGENGDELYDLNADPRERTNVAAVKPEVVEHLRGELEKRAARRADPAW